MKTVRIALMAMLTTFALAAGASAGQLEFIWTDLEDFYDSGTNTFVVNGWVDTPAAGETTVDENITLVTRPGTSDQAVATDQIDDENYFWVEVSDPANGTAAASRLWSYRLGFWR